MFHSNKVLETFCAGKKTKFFVNFLKFQIKSDFCSTIVAYLMH